MKGNWNLVKSTCKGCGKDIFDFKSRNRKYCNNECRKINKKKTKKCLQCNKEFKTYISSKAKFCCYKCAMDFRKNKKRTLEVREKIKNNIPRGKKHYNYKGGVYCEQLYIMIRHSLEMREWRKAVFKRDNYTCQNCKKRGGNLEAHHIKAFIIIINQYNIKTLEQALECKELWNINNGQTLCKDCHNLTKGKYD